MKKILLLFIASSFILCTPVFRPVVGGFDFQGGFDFMCDTTDFDLFSYFSSDKIVRHGGEVVRLKRLDSLYGIDSSFVVFTGSSSIRMWGDLEGRFSEFGALKRGFGGSTFPELIYYSDLLIFDYSPSVLVVYEGDNDQFYFTPSQIMENVCYLERLVHSRLPDTYIYFLSVKPSPRRRDKFRGMLQTNNLLKRFSDTTAFVGYIDVWSCCFAGDSLRMDIFKGDGIHLNAKGYELWYDLIYPVISDRFYGISRD